MAGGAGRELTLAGAVLAAAACGYAAYRLRARARRLDVTVGYWDIRGLAAPLRMMAAHAGAERCALRDVRYSLSRKADGGWEAPDWFARDKPELSKRNPLINLPYLELPDGSVVTQSNPCLAALATRLGLHGAAADRVVVEQLVAQAFDLRNDAVRLFYDWFRAEEDVVEDAHAYLDGVARGHYKKLDAWLSRPDLCRGGPFLLGAVPTTPDFAMWEIVDQNEMLARHLSRPSPLEGREKLRAHYEAFRSLPTLLGYFASDAYALPPNNRMARFLNGAAQ